MEDLLISILETFGYPVFLQGSLLPETPYPPHFFTFWNNDSFGNSYYDNCEASTVFSYDVNFYSIDPKKVYAEIRNAVTALKAAGFIVSGDGYSIGSDEPSHDGRGINVLYRRENNGN